MKKVTILAAAIGVVAIGLTGVGMKAGRDLRIASGYKAKIACSEIFVAGRDASLVIDQEFQGMDSAMDLVQVDANPSKKEVSAKGPLGLGSVRALYREGYGCTLVNGGGVQELPVLEDTAPSAAWAEAPPVSGQALLRVDYGALDAALSDAFENNDASHRSFLVAVDGKIVDERYTDGFDRDTPFLSWSMAKSVTATLVGAAVHKGYLDINDPAPVPEWSGDAQKENITWNDLLRMQSGLAFEEEYGKVRSEVNRMLFERADAGGFAAHSPVEHAPGDHWYYSSGTTNLIARTLRQVLTAEGVEFHAFANEALFGPIGASTAVLEPDASGTFIGSSYVYATARDWARLGQLYLQNGEWEAERLLPQEWAEYVRSPTAASDGQYGAQFWLNRDGAERERFFSGVPEEMYFFAGHEGQYVFIVPDKRMVMVRTGQTRGRSGMEATAPLVKAVYDAVGFPDGAGQ